MRLLYLCKLRYFYLASFSHGGYPQRISRRVNIITKNETDLIDLLHDFLAEMGAEHAARHVSMTADFEYDLGIDSLGRVELFNRVEELINAKLPSEAFANAQNLKDLQRYLPTIGGKETSLSIKTISKKLSKEDTGVPSGHTLIDSLHHHVEQHPEKVHIYLQNEDGSETPITYGDLYRIAQETACGFIKEGLKPRETVAIMLPTSQDFFAAFFGILLAGGIPVPIYPPFRPNRLEEYVQREAKTLNNACVKFLITFHEAENLSHLLQGFIPTMKKVVTVESLRKSGNSSHFKDKLFLPSDPAFIQYTSGSTGDPKGVLLSHGNLLANIKAMGEALGVSSEDHVVSWLPLYHDMGLIGCWLGSLHFGIPLTVMSPLAFLSRPERWLWAIHAHGGTISSAPNFAYEICIRKIKEESIEGLDLSSWRIAANGAETVHVDTLSRFIEKFKPYGFKPPAVFPVYGLAENSVGLAFPPLDRQEPLIDLIDRKTLEKEGFARKTVKAGADTLKIASCGRPIPGHKIKIVNKEGRELPERTIGNLWFSGPSAMQGYYNNPEATKKTKHGNWLDSGDLAYIAEGELFITGRVKDMIIKAGRNIYPQDIESTTSSVKGVRKGCVIAFGLQDIEAGTEKLIIVADTSEENKKVREEMIHEISSKVVTDLGLPPDVVLLVPAGTVPKTSSGKLKRSACKQAYLANELEQKRPPVWLQIITIATKSFFSKFRTLSAKCGLVLFTGYVGIVTFILVFPVILSVSLTPQRAAQKLMRFLIRFLLALSGWRIKIINPEKLKQDTPCIYVANHTSYLDSLVLLSILPPGVSFVGKRELFTFTPLRLILKKLGHLMVERQDVMQSLEDLKQITKAVKLGQSLMIFPEGTFSHISGLRPFKLGAFKLAVETGTPVCPITVTGTRQLLPADAYLLHPGTITITLSDCIKPKNQEWTEILRLRSASRQEIAKYCGEPLLLK